MNIEGVVVVSVHFTRTGKVMDMRIVSGPAMAQQPVLDSVKNWTFRPVRHNGRLYGGCGILLLHVVLKNGQIVTAIED